MLNTEQSIKFIKAIAYFTNINDLREFVNNIYLLKEEDKYIYYATNGHIAIRAVIFGAIVQINDVAPIKEIAKNDFQMEKFNRVFEGVVEPEKTKSAFDPNYIIGICKSIKTIATLFGIRSPSLNFVIREKPQASFINTNSDNYIIDVAIMPRTH